MALLKELIDEFLFCYGDEQSGHHACMYGHFVAQIVQWTIALRGPEWNEEPLIIDVRR